MLQTTLIALALSALTLAVSGCGKSSKVEGTQTQSTAAQSTASQPVATVATTRPSHPEADTVMIKKANAICKRIIARRASYRATTQQQFVRMAAEQAMFERSVLAEMSALTPTGSSLVNAWRQIVPAAQALATATAKIGEYAGSGQLGSKTGISLVNQRRTIEFQALALAKRVGIVECSLSV
jgi:hypothetical protein